MLRVTDQLKALRTAAKPPITVREMAERLGMAHPTYHRYESSKGYKGRFLPMDLTRRIAAVLQDHGINPDDVLALAGIGVDEASQPALSAGEEQLIDGFRDLEPEQRQLFLQLMSQMRATRPNDTPHTRSASVTARGDRRSLPKEHA
jgi:transcriptional regulator with XRE-family HTH domain